MKWRDLKLFIKICFFREKSQEATDNKKQGLKLCRGREGERNTVQSCFLNPGPESGPESDPGHEERALALRASPRESACNAVP